MIVNCVYTFNLYRIFRLLFFDNEKQKWLMLQIYMHYIPIRDGQLGLICQITWHQNLNMAVSGFYPDRAFWSLLGDTAMLEGWIRLFMFRVACVCQNIDGVVWWTLLIGAVVSTVIRFLIRSSTHISGWLYITVSNILCNAVKFCW